MEIGTIVQHKVFKYYFIVTRKDLTAIYGKSILPKGVFTVKAQYHNGAEIPLGNIDQLPPLNDEFYIIYQLPTVIPDKDIIFKSRLQLIED